MAKINTLNYQTVASWNGSQDLFIVEQPDGTKVATPAMVKQFIEAGDFEATGEVKDGHGNVLKDMAISADVDAKIGDLTETGLAGDSVAEQLGTVENQIEEKSGTITLNSGWDFDLQAPSSVKKIGNIAWLSAYIYNVGNLSTDTEYVVGTLPAGFVPAKPHRFPIFRADNTSLRGVIYIENDGKIKYRSADGSRYILYSTVVYPLT